MKPNIHPQYYTDARVVCACGTTWTTGSTKPELRVDVCSTCHPFYTGEQRIMDTAGQVDRFMKRLERRQNESARREIEAQARKEAEEGLGHRPIAQPRRLPLSGGNAPFRLPQYR